MSRHAWRFAAAVLVTALFGFTATAAPAHGTHGSSPGNGEFVGERWSTYTGVQFGWCSNDTVSGYPKGGDHLYTWIYNGRSITRSWIVEIRAKHPSNVKLASILITVPAGSWRGGQVPIAAQAHTRGIYGKVTQNTPYDPNAVSYYDMYSPPSPPLERTSLVPDGC